MVNQTPDRQNGRLRHFLTAEDGVMAPIMLIFFFLMLVLGGIAIDVMRFEARRVTVQNTMDAATLAAASLGQTLDPRAVVNDYFTKAGLGLDLDDVDVDEGVNFRTVTANARVVSRNYFMSMLNIPTLEAVNRSQAEQRVNNVELALVLDISGSMHVSPTRIQNLKIAAAEFIDTVLDQDTENRISIALVPYNGQVNLGPELFAKFTTSHQHSGAGIHCIDLPTSTYSTAAISRSTPYPQAPFADTFTVPGYTLPRNSYWAPDAWPVDTSRGSIYTNIWCHPAASNIVRPMNNNRAQLKSQINGLIPVGATSIDLGMKWGTAMLDPAWQSINSELAGAGRIPAHFANRPAPYSDRETMKVIVLMTDGENFEMERMADAYRTGPSSIWRGKDNNLSMFHPSKVNSSTSTTICNSKPYWVPHLSAWHPRPWNGTMPNLGSAFKAGECYTPGLTSLANATHLNWPDVWKIGRMQWLVWQLWARALGSNDTNKMQIFNNTVAAIRERTATSVMDGQLATVCNAAKSNGILVYGIAFETSPAGKAAIQSCVSSPRSNYYYDVEGLQIRTAFRLIASNLSQLRLTQ